MVPRESEVAIHRPIGTRYDELAGEYDSRWKGYIAASLKLVTDVVALSEGARLLDAPCGTGELFRRLADRSPQVQFVGVDASAAMIRRAHAKHPEATAWCQADVARLPFSNASFDTVVSASSLHYFAEPAAALAELHRVTRPGGQFILVDWCADFLTIKCLDRWLRWTEPGFVRAWSLGDCRRLVEEAGFEVLDAERLRLDWFWGMMRIVGRRAQESMP